MAFAPLRAHCPHDAAANEHQDNTEERKRLVQEDHTIALRPQAE